MNIFTNTKQFTLVVLDAENNPVNVKYFLSRRWGFQTPMVLETVSHFAFACSALASDMSWDYEHTKFQEFQERTSYDYLPEPLHHEARVAIFSDYIPVWSPVAKCVRFEPLNIFTEETSAWQLWDAITHIRREDLQVEEINNRLKPEQPIQNTPQKPTAAPPRSAPPQGQSSELDKHFGPKQEAPEASTNGLPEGVIAGEVGQPPIIQSWDYKLEDVYNQFFSGKRVQVEIGKVERVIVAKNDGSGSYEVIKLWPFYNGEFPKYCPYSLWIFIDTEPRKFSDWKTFAKDWEAYFPAPGSSHTGRGMATFKISPSKKEDDDRVFWNFSGLRFDEPFDPPGEDMPAHERAEAEGDIPF